MARHLSVIFLLCLTVRTSVEAFAPSFREKVPILTAAPKSPLLTFAPNTLIAGIPATVEVSLDIANLPKSVIAKVKKFIVYQVDPFTRERLGIKFDLKDKDKALYGKGAKKDFVFSTLLPFRSDHTFGSLSFEAIPVIKGNEDPRSELAVFAANAISVFPPSPSMDIPSLEHVTKVPSLKGLELLVTYVWKSDLNLNTATEFLRDIGGYRCPGHSDLVVFEGEERDLVAQETAVVHLGRALEEGKWKHSTLIKLKAGWKDTKSQEPAEVIIVLRDATTKEEIPETQLALPIIPGSQKLCAKDIVAVVNVLIDKEAHVSLSALQ